MEYNYNFDFSGGNVSVDTTGLAILTCMLIISFIFVILMVASMWKIYKKAGKKGWTSIVPIYSNIVLFDIIGYSWWHLLIMMFVPMASMVYSILIPLELAKKFNQKIGFSLILLFCPIIGYPLLAFGDYHYLDNYDTSKDYTKENVDNEDHYYNAQLDNMSQQQINEMVAQQVAQNNVENAEFNESFEEIEEEKAVVKTCPVCGNNVGATLTECFMCGHIFE